MARPWASTPSSSRYAIASAVTAGCRRVNASASRCARSLDHDVIEFQASTSVGRSVMTAHALVAARRRARQVAALYDRGRFADRSWSRSRSEVKERRYPLLSNLESKEAPPGGRACGYERIGPWLKVRL